MSDFKNSLDDFYKVLTPLDLYGKTRQIANNSSVTLDREVYENYLVGTYSGKEIISNLKGKQIDGLGVYFNTVFQGKDSNTPEYLEDQYWQATSAGDILSGTSPSSPPANFYAEVCQKASTNGPPIDFSINLLRSTYAAPGTSKGLNAGKAILPYGVRNCDAVEFFLNYMPSIFPSMMVPYFEVEFDFPVKLPSQDPNDNRAYDAYYLNRPSLLRFLLGSAEIGDIKSQKINLTEADKSLIFAKQAKTRSGKVEPVYSIGMELFTSPQTLTNMDRLKGGPNTGRVVDVKPFLPPATLTGGSMNLTNAGASVFASRKASIQFTVHDKARVSEFSEFFRVAQGTQDLTVWLTFGWLAPRGDTENDAYARFINQTMLTKFGFNISNASFSFDNYGQANVSVELVSQGTLFVDTYQLTYEDGDQLFSAISSIKQNIQKIEDARAITNNFSPQLESIKFVQDLKSMLSNAGPKSLSREEKSKISSLKTKLNNFKLAQDTKDALSKGLDAIETLGSYYEKNSGRLRSASRSYSAKKFEECRDINSPDPFLPEDFKKDIIVGGKTYSVHGADLINIIKELNIQHKVIEVTSDKKVSPPIKKVSGTRRYASFGKVFSSFCLPPLLEHAKSQGIEEVQVNFYQLNESCGELSLQNISEFPIDMVMLEEMFATEAEKLGGDMMTISRFMQFVVNTYMGDDRAVGYGLTTYYEDYAPQKSEMKKKPPQYNKVEKEVEEKDPEDSKKTVKVKKDIQVAVPGTSFDERLKVWLDKHTTLRHPHVNVLIEVLKKRTTTSNIDLLTEIRNPDSANLPRIMKVHVFDSHANPYNNIKNTILRNAQGAYLGLPKEKIDSRQAIMEYDNETQTVTVGDVTIVSKSSQNPLIEYVGNTVPTIQVGSNGSLISSIGFSSKMDAKLATALMVPSQKNFRNMNTLSPNGLMMMNSGLPVRITDASVSMTSLGCPIADLYQHFYIDFGTGTTLDNIYAATSINHSFGPGKFETTWAFLPVDGYAAFAGAQSTASAVKAADEAMALSMQTKSAAWRKADAELLGVKK